MPIVSKCAFHGLEINAGCLLWGLGMDLHRELSDARRKSSYFVAWAKQQLLQVSLKRRVLDILVLKATETKVCCCPRWALRESLRNMP